MSSNPYANCGSCHYWAEIIPSPITIKGVCHAPCCLACPAPRRAPMEPEDGKGCALWMRRIPQ